MTTPAPGAQPTQASSTSPAPAAAAPGAGAAVQQPAAGAAAPAQGAPATPAAQQPNLGKLVIENRKLQEQIKQLTTKATKGDEYESLLAEIKDPGKRFAAAERLGITYSEYTEHILAKAGDKSEPSKPALPKEVQDALAELDALKKKVTTREDAETKAAQQQQVTAARAEAKKLVDGLGDDAELVAAFGGYDAVIREWKRLHEETGAPPDDATVAKAVEQQYEATLGSQLGTLLKAKKGKALIAKALGVDAAKLDALIAAVKAGNGQNGKHQASPQANPGQKGDGTAPTLTNEMSAEGGGAEIPFHKLTPKQKRELAGQRARARTAS